MKAQPQPIVSRMYFCPSTPPYTIGARSPAAAATSTKRARKGRPDGAGLASGFAVWLAIPWANARRAAAGIAEASESCTNARRVTLISSDVLGVLYGSRVLRDTHCPLATSLATKTRKHEEALLCSSSCVLRVFASSWLHLFVA